MAEEKTRGRGRIPGGDKAQTFWGAGGGGSLLYLGSIKSYSPSNSEGITQIYKWAIKWPIAQG